MPYEYKAVFSRQRDPAGPLLASFVAPAGEVAAWADVRRSKHEDNSHQRLRNESKIRAITRFLDLDERNTIPTALVVALRLPGFEGPATGECATVAIPDSTEPRPGLVIDGQHRMCGVEAHNRDLPLNVVALINPADEEIAFQFLVIHGKASKIPAGHVRRLSLRYLEDDLADRLRTARMSLDSDAFVGVIDSSVDSPFYKSVEWPGEPNGRDADRVNLVQPAGIERAVAEISRKNLPDLANDDALIEFFFTLWWSVRKHWPDLWTADSRLLQNAGLVGLTKFVIEDLVPLADRDDLDLADPSATGLEIQHNILNYLDSEFWRREWNAERINTTAGRECVVDALRAVRRNLRRGARWDSDLAFVAEAERTH